jgi:TolB-like protein
VYGHASVSRRHSGLIFKAILDGRPTSAVRLNPDLPAELERIINKALEKDRNLRYQHASEIRADLQRLKRDTESGKAIASGTATPRWSRRTMLIGAVPLVCAIAVIAVAALYFGRSGQAFINSVAVLPFANASGDPNSEYLSDGITEDVIDRLSGLPNLRVISRTSAFRYKGRDIEPQKVAKELGVEALVMGRLFQRGDDVSVSAELVDAREDKQLWGEQYKRKLADITSVQQDIATAISGNLRVRLTSEEKTRSAKTYVANPEAYQLYLNGRYHANKGTYDGLMKGIEYFQQAIAKDPNYALAYASLADSYVELGGLTYLPPSEAGPKARAAAMKALELDDSLGEAHAALARAQYYFGWDWPSAEREFKRAVELNPKSAISHHGYSELLLARARFDESIAEGMRALEIDPLSPLFEGGAGETIRRELLKQCDVHTLLRLPTGIFYAQGVKANVLFFDRKPASETAWTKTLWIYDFRTNEHFTLKTNPLKRAELDDFVASYNPENRHQRKETDRFKPFAYEDLLKRDKVSLDIFWLKDESLEDSANLPDPHIIAAEIAEDLQAALDQFTQIAADLKNP